MEILWKIYYKYNIHNGNFFLAYLVVPKNYDNLFICILYGGIFTIINSLIVFAFYFLTKQLKFAYRFTNFIRKKDEKTF